MSWLALDIGGANLKAAHESGMIRSVPFALWKEPENLADALRSLFASLPPFEGLAVTMTGELCDCFRTKAEGVKHLLASVDTAFQTSVGTSFPDHIFQRVWGVDGRFHTFDYAMNHEVVNAVVAASNWLALATHSARKIWEGLLIDIGSTTADIIPLLEGRPIPEGRTDTDRLRTGELIYAGVKRTPICALASTLSHRGQPTGLAAELFATTWDVYVTLRDLEESPEDRSTADGRPATVEFARERLARMVGADREGFSYEDAIAFACDADSVLTRRLVDAARRVSDRSLGGPPKSVVVSGSGEFLANRVAEQVVAEGGSIVRLSQRWGRAESDAACAYALLLLAREDSKEVSP